MPNSIHMSLTNFLPKIPYFEGLTGSVYHALATVAGRCTYQTDAVLFLRGELSPTSPRSWLPSCISRRGRCDASYRERG